MAKKSNKKKLSTSLTSGKDMSVGQTREDGTIYLGYKKGKDWFTTAEDARENGKRLTMNFNDASGYAESLKAHNHADWGVADKEILNKMYKARNTGDFEGTYNESATSSAGWYWSSKEDDRDDTEDFAWGQSFSYDSWGQSFSYDPQAGKERGWDFKDVDASVRPVRSEPRPPV